MTIRFKAKGRNPYSHTHAQKVYEFTVHYKSGRPERGTVIATSIRGARSQLKKKNLSTTVLSATHYPNNPMVRFSKLRRAK